METLTGSSLRAMRVGRARGPVARVAGHLVFFGTLALALAIAPAPLLRRSCGSDLIRAENQKPGSADWQLTRVRPDRQGFRSPWIEGYCSKQSVKAGESLQIMVSSDPPRSFAVEIFRMGYYGGPGARLMKTLGPLDGKAQPVPAAGPKNLHECKWKPSATLEIPRDWPSGVYLGRL